MPREALKYDAVDSLIKSDDIRSKYLAMTAQVIRLHKDIKPHPAANELMPDVVIYSVLAQMIRALMPPIDIAAVMEEINDILDESIAAEGYKIQQGIGDKAKRINLSEIDFEALQQKFQSGHKNTATQELRSAVEEKIMALVEKNRSRMNYLEKFQKLIEEYNAGSGHSFLTFGIRVQSSRTPMLSCSCIGKIITLSIKRKMFLQTLMQITGM